MQRRRAPARACQSSPAGGPPLNLTETCIREPVLAWMVIVGTVVFEAVTVIRIDISQMPNVEFPTINV